MLQKIISIIIFSLFILSCGKNNSADNNTKREFPNYVELREVRDIEKHKVDGFGATMNKDNNKILTALLCNLKPMHESFIQDVNVIDSDSVTTFYFNLSISDPDSNQYLELRAFNDNEFIVFSPKLRKNLPINVKALKIFENNRSKNSNRYPYYNKWKLSGTDFIECTTFKGCIDTDRANVTFYRDSTEINTLSNLGWVSLIKYDINKNKKDDVIIVSNKCCEIKLDFYAIVY